MKLKDIYLFKDVNTNLAHNIIDNSRTIEVKEDEEIIKQWDKSDNNAYIIKSWIAHVVIDWRNIKTLKAWDIFGEIALITDEPRIATIKAITNMKLLKINKNLLFDIIKQFPNWDEIQKTMIKRITENLKNSR